MGQVAGLPGIVGAVAVADVEDAQGFGALVMGPGDEADQKAFGGVGTHEAGGFGGPDVEGAGQGLPGGEGTDEVPLQALGNQDRSHGGPAGMGVGAEGKLVGAGGLVKVG